MLEEYINELYELLDKAKPTYKERERARKIISDLEKLGMDRASLNVILKEIKQERKNKK